jgi:hypothetical protein
VSWISAIVLALIGALWLVAALLVAGLTHRSIPLWQPLI